MKQPPEAIPLATAKEADRLPLAVPGIDAFQRPHVEPVIVAINKWRNEPAFIKNPYPLRRRINEIGVPGIEVIGSQELAEQDRCVHGEKDRAGQYGYPVAAEFPPHHPPL